MLTAMKGFVIVKRVEQTGILKEVEDDRTTKGTVTDALYNGPGVGISPLICRTVYYVPHSALAIKDNDGKEYFAVPEGDIVAVLSPDSE